MELTALARFVLVDGWLLLLALRWLFRDANLVLEILDSLSVVI